MNINWNIVGSIGTIASPLMAIIIYYKSRKDEINNNKLINDQLKFEDYIVNLLEKYDEIYNNVITPYLMFNKDNSFITVESLFYISAQCTIANTFLSDVISKLKFYYKYNDLIHPEFDNFIKDISIFNSSLSSEILNYQMLVTEASKINDNTVSNVALSPSEFTNKINKIYGIVDKRGIIINEITRLFIQYKSILYDEADKVIKERANIIKRGRIYEKERKKGFFNFMF